MSKCYFYKKFYFFCQLIYLPRVLSSCLYLNHKGETAKFAIDHDRWGSAAFSEMIFSKGYQFSKLRVSLQYNNIGTIARSKSFNWQYTGKCKLTIRFVNICIDVFLPMMIDILYAERISHFL